MARTCVSKGGPVQTAWRAVAWRALSEACRKFQERVGGVSEAPRTAPACGDTSLTLLRVVCQYLTVPAPSPDSSHSPNLGESRVHLGPISRPCRLAAAARLRATSRARIGARRAPGGGRCPSGDVAERPPRGGRRVFSSRLLRRLKVEGEARPESKHAVVARGDEPAPVGHPAAGVDGGAVLVERRVHEPRARRRRRVGERPVRREHLDRRVWRCVERVRRGLALGAERALLEHPHGAGRVVDRLAAKVLWVRDFARPGHWSAKAGRKARRGHRARAPGATSHEPRAPSTDRASVPQEISPPLLLASAACAARCGAARRGDSVNFFFFHAPGQPL